MKLSACILCLSLTLTAVPIFAQPALNGAVQRPTPITTQVTLPSGTVQGIARDTNGVEAFKGIPFAAPPVGDLRWRSPKPVMPWTGVLDATEFRPSCISTPNGPSASESEDCLTANVWTAAQALGEKRPVMVWIPGGGFEASMSSRINADGAQLATKDVIVVSFNYRVGVYGFLSHPALDREGSPSGNFGLQDELAALKWVHANIAYFGGDPSNVTIFGESAGAASVGLLMSSPLAKGQFQKAIGESGAFWDSVHGSLLTRAEAQALGQTTVDRLGHGSIAEMRALSAKTLSAEATVDFHIDPLPHFSPSIDGYVLTGTPADIFASGRQAKVPLLAGWNESEGVRFKNFARPATSAAQFRAEVAAWLGASNMPAFLQLYPADTDVEAAASTEALLGDTFIEEQTWEWLELQRRTSNAPVYGYNFTLLTPYTPVATHTDEIDYVFGTLKKHWLSGSEELPNARDRELAQQMMSYWANFARTGDPNAPGLPVWPSYRTGTPEVMVFGATTAPAPVRDADIARFRFIQGFRGKDGRLPQTWRSDALAP